MNHQLPKTRSRLAFAVGVSGTFLIVAALVWMLRQHSQPPPLDAKRIAERSKAIAELRAAEAEALSTPVWIDKNKGLVRLPIEVAMERVLEEWQDPDAARSNLIARVTAATAAPPAAPSKPSEFE